MQTYYEILGINPGASQQEVESAIDTRYNQVRRLVTHHDPKVADQANQGLRTLELIRNTLGNAFERAKYDASLNVGGLAELDSLLQPPPAAPPPAAQPGIGLGAFAAVPPRFGPPSRQPQAAAAPPPAAQVPHERVDAWNCPRCKNYNPIGEKFCAHCGNQLADACPSCAALTELSKPFCSKCGADKNALIRARKQARIQSLQADIQQVELEIQEIQRLTEKIPLAGFDASNPDLHEAIWVTGGWGCLGSFGFWVLLVLSGWLGYSAGMGAGAALGWTVFFFCLIGGAIITLYLEKAFRQNTVARPNAGKMVDEKRQQIAMLQQQIRQV